ncbi:MAG: hypothetical protein ACOX5G_03590 [Kiritimatiellia bacterium]|jgi:hypothetical protein
MRHPSGITALSALAAAALFAQDDIPQRQIWLYAASDAPAEVRLARDSLATDGAPFLSALAATQGTTGTILADDFHANPPKPGRDTTWLRQAFNHIVLVGLPGDPVMARTKGFVFGIDERKREVYSLGFGRFQGDIGVVEVSFNPYLYHDHVFDNPFSTLMVRLSGTTPEGVSLALDAFRNGLIHGIVPGPGARRIETSILDRDPDIAPPPAVPPCLADAHGEEYVMAGWMQCPESEYRAFLDWGAKRQPTRLSRIKYFARDSLGRADAKAWVDGPFEKSWGNAVTIVDFADEADAAAVFGRVRKEVREAQDATVGEHPAFALPFPKDEAQDVPGRTVFILGGARLVLASLPDDVLADIAAALFQ